MATKLKNLSQFDTEIPRAESLRFGIVVSEWNSKITGALLEGAVSLLKKQGAKEKDILIRSVPGSYELTLGAQLMCEHTEVDAVIALGCVIQGETPHFDYICSAVAHGLTDVAREYNTPVIFGVLTTLTMEQAEDRSGGKYGNKGDEAAVTAIRMARLKIEMEEEAE